MSAMPADEVLPDTYEVLIINRASHNSVAFTLPTDFDKLEDWINRCRDRYTSPADYARQQGWITASGPSKLRMMWAAWRAIR